MFTQSYFKNNYYIESTRNYLDDYSNIISKEIDMTLSGRYLSRYPVLKFNYAKLDRYPLHTHINRLKNEIKKVYNISDNKSVVLGAGSNGILQNIVKLLFKTGDNLVTPYLTFDQAEFAVTSLGGTTRRCYMDKYDISLDNITNSTDLKTKLIYICNPNNPTGKIISNKEIINFAKLNKDINIIIDESNIEFSNQKSLLAKEYPENIIVLKSFSKAYGLANLRIGYMVCQNSFADEYNKNTTVNEFSGVSCEIALQVLRSKLYLKNVKKVKKQLKFIDSNLNRYGIKSILSNSNTLLTETAFPKKAFDILNNNNVSVVPIFDQDNLLHFRIAIQDSKTNKKFIKKMKEVCNKNYL